MAENGSEELSFRKYDIAILLEEREKLLAQIKTLKTQLFEAGIAPISPVTKSAPDLTRFKRYSLPVYASESEHVLATTRQSSCGSTQCLSTYDKRSGTSDYGKQYEYIMCAFYAVRFATSDNVRDFEMTTNDEIYGDFDDIALKVSYVNGTNHTYLLQLKHTENKKRLTENNLAAENKDFSVMKYLKTFEKLVERTNVSCILFTNRTAYFKELSQLSLNNVQIFVKEKILCEDLLDTNQTSKKSVFQFGTAEPTDDGIAQFLQHFYLFANQNNVTKMNTLITELLKQLLQRDVYSTFIHFMKNWWSGNFVLTKSDVIAKLVELAFTPAIINVTIGSCDRKSGLLQDAILKFDMTLVSSRDTDLVDQISIESPDIREFSLTALKYGLTSKGIANVTELTDEQISKTLWYLNQVPLIIKVDDCNQDTVRSGIKLLERIEPKKRLVLFSTTLLRRDFPHWKIFDSLYDLTNDELYQRITKNFEVSLQGRTPIPLETFFNSEETSRIIGVKELLMMTKEPLLVGDKRIELPDYYIRRTVSTNFLSTERILNHQSNDLLILICTKEFRDLLRTKNLTFSDLGDYETDSEISLVVANRCSKIEFDGICRKTNQRVHLVKVLDNQSSILVLSSDNNYCEEFWYEREPITEDNIYRVFDNPINVLCAQPGIGKSTMIKYLDNTCPSDYWSVRVNLRKFNSLLKEEPEEEEILLHFLELDGVVIRKSLVEQVKTLFFENRKIYLFLDGLDEIESNCVGFALDYVNYIASTGVYVWISSRQNLQEMITTHLNIFPIDIQELKTEEQTSYIQKRLEPNYVSHEIEQITKEIFDSANVANSHNMLGIPLQLYIITENFLDDMELYHKRNEEIFVLTKMYKIFFDGKKKHLYEKVGVQYEQQLGFNFNLYLENYEIPALRCCLDDNTFTRLNLEDNSKTHEFLDTIKNEGDKFGIITQINDEDRAVFAHQTYAEYFACLWIKKNFDKTRFLKSELKSDKYQNLKLIFDIMLAENCPLHLAVIYQNSEQVKKHLINIASRDEGGRSALHLICSYGSKYIPLHLEQSLYSNHLYHDENQFSGESRNYREIFRDLAQCDPFETDQVFKWSALDYCFHYHCLYPVEKFLEQYGEKIKLDYLFDSLNSVTLAYYSSKLGYPNLLEAVIRRNRGVLHFKIGDEKLTFLHVAVKGVGEDREAPTLQKREATTLKIIKILIRNGIDVNSVDKNGASPLHLAVTQGRYDIVKVLLDEGAEINATDNKEETIIYYALHEWEQQLKTLKVDSGELDFTSRDKEGTTLLHWACKEGDYDLVKKLLEKEASVTVGANNGETVLHYAVRAWKPNLEIIKLLVDSGLDVNSKDSFEISPLHWAFHKGHYDIIGILHQKGANVTTITSEHKTTLRNSYKQFQPNMKVMEMLMDYGFNVNAKNSDGTTVLHRTAEKGHLGVVKLLIANGANVNAVSRTKETVLHYASKGWNTNLIKIFTEIGFDMNFKDNNGTTPLHRAAEYGRLNIVKALLENGAHITYLTNHEETVLNFAVKSHEPNLEVIEFLLSKGIDVNSWDLDGISALHWACERGRYSIVKLLLEKGANVNSVTRKGETPLHYADPSPEIIRLLLSSGVDVNVKDVSGMTALHWAAERGQFDLVKILLDSGADVNSTTTDEETPLIYAVKQRKINIEMIKVLVNSGATVDTIDKNGMNALHWASDCGHYDVVKILLEKAVDVNSCTNKGQTALHFASKSWKPNTEIIKRLVLSGVAINTQDGDGSSALHWASKEGHYTNAELLIELGADVQQKTKNNEETTLHFASKAWKNNDVVLQLLINNGVDVNTVDKDGKTALHWAAEKGFYSNVMFLLDNGAVIDAVTGCNLTALHFAVYGGHVRIIKLLLERGLDINKVDAKNTNLPLYFATRHGHLKEDLLVMMAATIHEKFPLLSWNRYSYSEVITYLQEAQPYLAPPSVMRNVSTSMSEQPMNFVRTYRQLIGNSVGPYITWMRNWFGSLNCKKVCKQPRTPTFIVHYPVFPTSTDASTEQEVKTPTIDRSYTF